VANPCVLGTPTGCLELRAKDKKELVDTWFLAEEEPKCGFDGKSPWWICLSSTRQYGMVEHRKIENDGGSCKVLCVPMSSKIFSSMLVWAVAKGNAELG